MSSNPRELQAISLAFFHFAPLLKGKAVKIRSDNMTSVLYIRKQGGTRSQPLLKEVGKIFVWAEANLSHLTAVHIHGSLNVIADRLSRDMATPREWSLDPEIFKQTTHSWGMPDVDLMATRLNAMVPRFCSLYREDNPLAVDTMSIPWRFRLAYFSPPVSLIHNVLRKLRQDQATVMAILPFWPKRSWFPQLLQMSQGQFWRLLPQQNLITQGSQVCQDLHRFNLTAWRLTSPYSEQGVSRRRFVRLCLDPEPNLPTGPTPEYKGCLSPGVWIKG